MLYIYICVCVCVTEGGTLCSWQFFNSQVYFKTSHRISIILVSQSECVYCNTNSNLKSLCTTVTLYKNGVYFLHTLKCMCNCKKICILKKVCNCKKVCNFRYDKVCNLLVAEITHLLPCFLKRCFFTHLAVFIYT